MKHAEVVEVLVIGAIIGYFAAATWRLLTEKQPAGRSPLLTPNATPQP